MKKALVLLLVFLVLSTVSAEAADKWTEVRSKNFLFVGNASEGAIRDVAEEMELFRWGFSQFFTGQNRPTAVKTTVYVFRSDDSFKPYKPLYKGKPTNVAGFFQGGQDGNYIALSVDLDTPRVIYHEYVHKMMDGALQNPPLWFEEGFAEAFSTLEVEGKARKLRMGRAVAEHVELFSERVFMPLDKLFAVTHESKEYNEEDKQGVFYAESWALVHYLMLGEGGKNRPKLFQFLDGLRSGIPTAQAFQAAFQTDMASFQKVFEAYIQQRLAWPAMELTSPPGFEKDHPMETRTLSDAESAYYIGDLMLHINRLPEAETNLANALLLNDKLPGAQMTMGLLRMRQNKDSEAIVNMRRAVELDPSSHMAHYHYASLIGSSKARLTDEDMRMMRSELRKTVELAPQFTEAVQMLASLNIAANVDIPQTSELLRKAMESAPGNNSLMDLLISALMRSPEREAARPYATQMASNATASPAFRQNAKNALDALDRAVAAAKGLTQPVVEVARKLPTEIDPLFEDDEPLEIGPRVQRDLFGETEEIVRVDDPSLNAANVQNVTNLGEPLVLGGVATPPVDDGTARVQGLLTRLDCQNGLTLSVMVDGKTVKLHSGSPDKIKFTSSGAGGEIACGPAPAPGKPVTVTYRPGNSKDNLGDPVAVEFEDIKK